MAITVVALDDHQLIREGVRRILEEQGDVRLVAEGAAGEDLHPLVEAHNPDIVLLDLGMPQYAQPSVSSPQFAAFTAIAQLRQEYPRTRIIIVSQYGTRILLEGALEAGVSGYLLKNDALTETLVAAIRMVHVGGVFFSQAIGRQLLDIERTGFPRVLTERQREIIQAVAARPDLLQAEHAQRLGISEHTFKQHLRQIYRALDVPNLTAAVLRAIRLRIVPLSYVTPVAEERTTMLETQALWQGSVGRDNIG